MGELENVAVLKRWFAEAYAGRSARAVDELVARDCLVHGLGGEVHRGREAFRAFYEALVNALPQLSVTVEQAIADGDWVAVRCRAKGRDARGNAIEFTGGGFCRIRGGQIAEAFNEWDFLTLCEQRGVIERGGLVRALDAGR